MLPLKEQIPAFVDDLTTRAEVGLRLRHVLVRRRLMRSPRPYEEREIYEASFYPKPGAPPNPRHRREPREKP